ncbi:MAG: thiamine biosynthesis protein ThiS [Planctomycetes bacterium]|nr:thiamine biosynthesis protein ThiS [Planctomycetota bacterium]
MIVVVNGKERTVKSGCTVEKLLQSLDIRGNAVAVELNREVIPRAEHAVQPVREGDTLEIVTFVGGG